MRFLVGADGSDRSLQAITETLERLQDGDEVTVAVYATDDDLDAVESQVRDHLDETEQSVELRRVTGDPGSTLVELAERDGYDRIVLAGGERSPLGKIQLGSVVEFVLLNARSTVTLVR
jgi:nucleotide-binding universal stress UspA family protein